MSFACFYVSISQRFGDKHDCNSAGEVVAAGNDARHVAHSRFAVAI